jgi:hypothetical protein
MVNYPTILNLPQDDINRQLYEMIVKLQKENAGEGTDISALEDDVSDIKDAIGDESTAASILGRIKALEDAE